MKNRKTISFRFDYTSCWSCVHKHCTRIWCILGVCLGCEIIDSLTFDRTFTIHYWHVYAPGFLHCTTACSWFTPLFFNNFWSKIKWHVWLIRRGLVGVQYIKVLKVYLRLFLPQSTSPWVYIFIIKQFELGSQTWDQSDHLALAPALVYKLTFFCVKIVST